MSKKLLGMTQRWFSHGKPRFSMTPVVSHREEVKMFVLPRGTSTILLIWYLVHASRLPLSRWRVSLLLIYYLIPAVDWEIIGYIYVKAM
jgi:hypothetical protein